MTRAIVPLCPQNLAEMFVGGVATAVTFEPDHRLYKLVNIPVKREQILRSPWWIREPEFDRLRQVSRTERRPLSAVVRERLAIASRWNPGLDGLCILHLARHKLGWVGLAAGQPKFGENLFGWGEQVCLPDLEWRDVAATRMQVPFFQSGDHPLVPLP